MYQPSIKDLLRLLFGQSPERLHLFHSVFVAIFVPILFLLIWLWNMRNRNSVRATTDRNVVIKRLKICTYNVSSFVWSSSFSSSDDTFRARKFFTFRDLNFISSDISFAVFVLRLLSEKYEFPTNNNTRLLLSSHE